MNEQEVQEARRQFDAEWDADWEGMEAPSAETREEVWRERLRQLRAEPEPQPRVDPRIARMLENGPAPSASPAEIEMYQELAEWHAANPEGTWAEFSKPREERAAAERREREDKREAAREVVRETFRELTGQPSRLADLARGLGIKRRPKNELEMEVFQHHIPSAMFEEVMEALDGSRASQGKYVRGVKYQGPPKDRSNEPYYTNSPTESYIAAVGRRVSPLAHLLATQIYQHNRRTYRAKDKGKRITMGELAERNNRDIRTVRRAVAELVEAGIMKIDSPGVGNRNGSIYSFPSRTEERPISEQGFTEPRPISEHEFA